jgi:dipeptide/tripeptide permease
MTNKKGREQVRKQIAVLALAAVVGFGGLAAAPAASTDVGVVAIEQAEAAPGGGNVKKIGDNTADLASEILVPILIVVIGAIAIVGLVKREAGMVIAAVGMGLVAGFFLIGPKEVVDTFEGVYKAVV